MEFNADPPGENAPSEGEAVRPESYLPPSSLTSPDPYQDEMESLHDPMPPNIRAQLKRNAADLKALQRDYELSTLYNEIVQEGSQLARLKSELIRRNYLLQQGQLDNYPELSDFRSLLAASSRRCDDHRWRYEQLRHPPIEEYGNEPEQHSDFEQLARTPPRSPADYFEGTDPGLGGFGGSPVSSFLAADDRGRPPVDAAGILRGYLAGLSTHVSGGSGYGGVHGMSPIGSSYFPLSPLGAAIPTGPFGPLVPPGTIPLGPVGAIHTNPHGTVPTGPRGAIPLGHPGAISLGPVSAIPLGPHGAIGSGIHGTVPSTRGSGRGSVRHARPVPGIYPGGSYAGATPGPGIPHGQPLRPAHQTGHVYGGYAPMQTGTYDQTPRTPRPVHADLASVYGGFAAQPPTLRPIVRLPPSAPTFRPVVRLPPSAPSFGPSVPGRNADEMPPPAPADPVFPIHQELQVPHRPEGSEGSSRRSGAGSLLVGPPSRHTDEDLGNTQSPRRRTVWSGNYRGRNRGRHRRLQDGVRRRGEWVGGNQ